MLLVGGLFKKVNAKNALNVMKNVHWTGLTGWHHQINAEEPNNLIKFVVACLKQIFKITQ
jgi:ATP-dependent Clp protease adapter protein ClpS